MLITYNLPFGQVMYGAHFKKHHVAYGVLYIESALHMHFRGGAAQPPVVASISTWFRKIAATEQKIYKLKNVANKLHLC